MQIVELVDEEYKQKDIAGTLSEFVDGSGVPGLLLTNWVAECVGRDTVLVKEAMNYKIKLHSTKPNRKNQNHSIGIET